jgi:hypothetical protein
MLRTPLFLLAALAVPMSACSDKSTALDSGLPGEEDGDGGGGGSEEAAVVWDDLHISSSVTLSGGFASGAGFYAIGEDGEVYVRSEGEWRTEGVNSNEPLNGIWGVRSGEVNYAIAVGDGGEVARLSDVGWSTAQELNTANMEAIDSADGASFVAVGWGGAYQYVDGAWQFQNIDGNPQFNDVWTDGTTSVAVGQDGIIAISNGGDWSSENLPSRVALYGVSASTNGTIWIVGENGTVMNNASGEWEALDVGTSATLWGVEVVDSTAFIVGNNGFAVRHDGEKATELPTGVDNNLYDITASGSGVIWAVGNRGATLRLQ